MTIYADTGVETTLLAASPVVELQPIYKEIPAIRPVRSESEKRTAGMMLAKLRRGEDRVVALPNAYDIDSVIDVVVERIQQVVIAGEGFDQG